jgi:hypothetical protein
MSSHNPQALCCAVQGAPLNLQDETEPPAAVWSGDTAAIPFTRPTDPSAQGQHRTGARSAFYCLAGLS